MIPFILATVGGYFVGSALKDKQIFADGGEMADGEIEKLARFKADNPNWTNEELLEGYNRQSQMLSDFNAGKIKPRKVIGGGYKSSAIARKLAKKTLENSVDIYKMALEIRGVMANGGKVKEYKGVDIMKVPGGYEYYSDVSQKKIKSKDLNEIFLLIDRDVEGEYFYDGGILGHGEFSKEVRKIMDSPLSTSENLLSVLLLIEESFESYDGSNWYDNDLNKNEYINLPMFKDFYSGIKYVLRYVDADKYLYNQGVDEFDLESEIILFLRKLSGDLKYYIESNEELIDEFAQKTKRENREFEVDWIESMENYLKMIKEIKNK